MKTMATAFGAFEAKTRFSELLDRVSRGAEITITKHDHPIAKLVPAGAEVQLTRKKATEDLRALRKRYSLKGLSARELIADGRA